jgi:hypothetical protein
MKREELEDLHYITPIANVASILAQGIVSHRLAARITHQSVAMQEIQDRRSKVEVPGGRKLHEYVNLYFCARNPMLYKRRADHETLCVLRVTTDIMDLADVVVADQNASSDYVRFGAPSAALPRIDYSLVFAESWIHDDPIETMRHRSIKCAEVLVPNRVAPQYVMGAYVSCAASQKSLLAMAPQLPVMILTHLFFR